MKMAYKMFHVDGNTERNNLYTKTKKIFEKYDELNSETFIISSYEDYINFHNNNLGFNIVPSGYNLDSKQGWKYGEIGIWASNWSAWNTFLKSDYDYLILMEDDLVCNEDLPQLIESYIDECPKDFHAFYMHVPADQTYKYNLEKSVSENISIAYQDWSCACYIVQKDTIKDMIDTANKGISLPLDWFMFRQQNVFKIYTLKPESYKGCVTKPIASTFQNLEDRKIINGIF